MADKRDSEIFATLKNILDDSLTNNTDEEIKNILSQQDNVEETVGNTLAQKYVEAIRLDFDEQTAGMKFYMKKSLNKLKKNFMREYANMTSRKDTLDILKFCKNDNNQLRKRVKDFHDILNRNYTTEHLIKSPNHKIEATEMENLNSNPPKDITEETTAESVYNTFEKKDQNAATETSKEKVTNQTSEIQNGKKDEGHHRAKKSKETVFIVGDSKIKKIDGYLLTKSINY